MTALTDLRATVAAPLEQNRAAAIKTEAILLGVDMAIKALRQDKPVKRDLRADVLAALTDAPKTAAHIQHTTGGRLRDIENILRRNPLAAQCIGSGHWVRVAGQLLAEAAE